MAPVGSPMWTRCLVHVRFNVPFHWSALNTSWIPVSPVTTAMSVTARADCRVHFLHDQCKGWGVVHDPGGRPRHSHVCGLRVRYYNLAVTVGVLVIEEM